MKKYGFVLLAIAFLFASCDKENIKSDKKEIEKYLEDNNINAVEQDSDIYFLSIEEGSGEQPTATDDVEVKYTGYYTDGAIFDNGNGDPQRFNLQQVIPGFREGILLTKEGGKSTIIIPSRLGYGSTPPPGIRKDAVLIFDIELRKVNPDEEIILNYLAENNLQGVRQDSGVYFVETEFGAGDHPSPNSDVEVKYTGSYSDGEVFDNGNGEAQTFNLQQVIPGFREGLLLMKRGSKGIILIPSRLGYGGNPPPSIRRNAVLIFDVELLDF